MAPARASERTAAPNHPNRGARRSVNVCSAPSWETRVRRLPIVAGVNDLCDASDPRSETKEGDPEPWGTEWSEDHSEREFASSCADGRLACGQEEGEACGRDKPNMKGPRINRKLLPHRIWCDEDCKKRKGAEEGEHAN